MGIVLVEQFVKTCIRISRAFVKEVYNPLASTVRWDWDMEAQGPASLVTKQGDLP